ncbi:MAG: metallophosphoesterase [Verrucomicrobia bacterium]|nr:metallophosphoesterase [Verrucomicrobiota bacterium]
MSFRFAHISDLHFFKGNWSPSQFLTKRWLGNCNYLFSRRHQFIPEKLEELIPLFEEKQVDGVLITGDLSTTSLPGEFAKAKTFVDALEKRFKHVYTIPGNHDQYTKSAYKNHLFYDYFKTNWGGSSCLKRDGLTLTEIGNNWWICALDTAVATSLLFSTGYFSPELEKRLSDALSSLPPDAQVILLNHFPLFSNESARKKLVRKEALRKLLEKHPSIKLYLHGHSHRHCIADLRKSQLPILLDSGSTAQKQGATWNLIDITPEGCSVQVYKNTAGWQPISQSTFTWEKHEQAMV